MTEVPNGIGHRLADMFMDATDKAVRDLANDVLRKARDDAPPSPPAEEDPSAVSLRDSGYVRKLDDGSYEIVFDAPYAAKQHESMHFEHPRGGGPKFLERNVQWAARQLEDTVSAEVRAVTRRSSGAVRSSTRTY